MVMIIIITLIMIIDVKNSASDVNGTTALSEGVVASIVSSGTAAHAGLLILILLHCSQQQWQINIHVARAKAETI